MTTPTTLIARALKRRERHLREKQQAVIEQLLLNVENPNNAKK